MAHRLRLQGRADKKSDDPVTATTRLSLRTIELNVTDAGEASEVLALDGHRNTSPSLAREHLQHGVARPYSLNAKS
jgi:hypothetical protein